MQIKDVCKHNPSDHFMLTPETIKKIDININSATIEAYLQAKSQEIRSFIKCVSSKHCKHHELLSRIGSLKRENITER